MTPRPDDLQAPRADVSVSESVRQQQEASVRDKVRELSDTMTKTEEEQEESGRALSDAVGKIESQLQAQTGSV